MKKTFKGMLMLALIIAVASALCIASSAAGHIHDGVTFETPIGTTAELNALFESGGSGYLTSDIAADSLMTAAAGSNVSLCLNGKTLTLGDAIRFNVAGTLNIYGYEGGTISDGLYTSKGGAAYIYNGGILNLYSGTIRNSQTTGTSGGNGLGGAVYIENGGTFNMYDGTIEGCTAQRYGGAVEAYGAFNMYGGTIDNCEAKSFNGGAVEVEGSGLMTMYGGTISNCKAINAGNSGKGGAVAVTSGAFIMKDGLITGCSASNGGGAVHAAKGNAFTMDGGKIYNCSASHGGGVNYAGTFTMNGGFIDTCSATVGGGGAYGWNGGTFILNGGTIQNCKTTAKNGHGGGVYSTGSFITMTGGLVRNNTAVNQAHGGGFYVTGGGVEWDGHSVPTTATFVMTGGEISGNSSTEWAGGGMFVGGQASFFMTGGTIRNNKKGKESWTYGSGVAVYEAKGSNLGNKISWIYIKGGTFSGNDIQKESGNEARMMLWSQTVTCTSCNYNGSYLNNTNVSTYDALKNAVASAPTNGTPVAITLTANITGDSTLTIPYDKNIVLNLNGKNLTKSTSNAFLYPCRCPFYLVNTSSTKSTVSGGSYAMYLYNGGDGYNGSNAWGNLKAHIIGNIYIEKVYCAGGTWLFRDTDNVSIGSRKDMSDSHRLYKLTLDANGGSGVPGKVPDTSSLYLHGLYKSSDGNLTLPTTAPNREGYTLKGWNTAANGSGTNYGFNYNNGNGVVATLYAQWSQNQTLTYNANGHGIAPKTVTMTYDKATNAAAAFWDENYVFLNWNTKADGSGTTYEAGETVKAANTDPAATTLYAQWKGNEYKVTLNANGGSCTALTGYTYGTGAKLPIPTKAGYTFAGWFDNDEFTGSAITEISKTDIGDKTFWAKWEIAAEVAESKNTVDYPSVQAKIKGDTAVMRFMWQVTFEDGAEINNVGAYIIPWGMFDNTLSGGKGAIVKYENPEIVSGDTFSADLTDIPREANGCDIFGKMEISAYPFINGTLLDKPIYSTVADADIDK